MLGSFLRKRKRQLIDAVSRGIVSMDQTGHAKTRLLESLGKYMQAGFHC